MLSGMAQKLDGHNFFRHHVSVSNFAWWHDGVDLVFPVYTTFGDSDHI